MYKIIFLQTFYLSKAHIGKIQRSYSTALGLQETRCCPDEIMITTSLVKTLGSSWSTTLIETTSKISVSQVSHTWKKKVLYICGSALKNASVFCFHFLLSRHIICHLWSEIYSRTFFKIKLKRTAIFIQVAWDCLLLYLEDISVQLSYINISYMTDYCSRKKRLYSNNCYCLNGKKKINESKTNKRFCLSCS